MDVKDLKVRVVYRNEKLDPTCDRTYMIQDYVDMIRMNLMRVITDVQDLVYTLTDNQTKDEWSDSTFVSFQHVKHKLLDNAGAIGRLPSNIIIGGEDNGKSTVEGLEESI